MPTDYKARLDEIAPVVCGANGTIGGMDRLQMPAIADELLSIARELLTLNTHLYKERDEMSDIIRDGNIACKQLDEENKGLMEERDRLREVFSNLAKEIASYDDPGNESMAETIRNLLDA